MASIRPFRLFPAVAVLAGAGPAAAHHAMDFALPATFGQGLLSGLGHPVIGIDHLAAILAVGLLAATFARGMVMPVAFVAATVAGAGVHLALVDIPVAEVAIALSLVVFGGLLAFRASLPAVAVGGLFALAGLFHGYAYGESFVGAEATPLAAYFVGFAAIQTAIALGAFAVGRWAAAGGGERAAAFRYAPASAIALLGVLALAGGM